MPSRDNKYKRWIFLASYTIYLCMNIVIRFMGRINRGGSSAAINADSAIGRRMKILNPMSMILFCGICFVLYFSMRGRRTLQSRPVKFLMTGFTVWLIWGIFVSFTGLSLFSGWENYRILIKRGIFTITLIMASKIVEVYNIRKELVGITAFILGTTLIVAYITHFNGLEFLSSISNVLAKNDRYRVSFGFVHVNTAGRACLDFFMFTAIYSTLISDSNNKNLLDGYVSMGGGNKVISRTDILHKYLILIYPAAIIILISTASRTSISGLAGFWLVYYLLGNYQNMRITTKAMMFTTVIFMCFIFAVVVDWGKTWDDFIIYSGRLENYTSTFPILTENGTWLTGLGFAFIERLNRLREMTALDSFYLYTVLESGLVGFVLLIGTIICFSFMYFRDTRYMTKFHKLSGGLLAVMLWYGFFESKMYGSDALDMLNWILLMSALHERWLIIYSRHKAAALVSRKHINTHENRLDILHNS